MTSEIKVDTISEQTSANGVTIDGLTIKDGNIIGDVALAGTTPTFTIGDAGAEDAALIFDGNAQDFYVALDDSADDLVIGTGSTIGSNVKMVIENGGNIGIGTASPDTEFHVVGAGTVANFEASDGAAFIAIKDADGTQGFIGCDTGALVFQTSGSSFSNKMSIATTGATTITTADNSDTLSLISTDADALVGPVLRLFRNSASPADDDVAGSIVFSGEDDAGNETDYASIKVITEDVTNSTEDGRLSFNIIDGGNAREVMSIFDNFVGIGTIAPEQLLHVHANDSGSSYSADGADRFILENNDSLRIDIRTPANATAGIMFSDTTRNAGSINFGHSTDNMTFNTGGGTSFSCIGTGQLSSKGEAAPDVSAGGLCLQQGANDSNILTLKSSDVGHGFTGEQEADTYGAFKKSSGTDGGLKIEGYHEGQGFGIQMIAYCKTAGFTASNTTGYGHLDFLARGSNGSTSHAALEANENLMSVRNSGDVKFIVKGNGEIFSDVAANTFDTYEDAQLVRAFDLSKGENVKGLINSKFDKYIKYNHETLADADLVGREEDGTPNHFVNVTGMQRLHNGAIWQQYEKHQRLAKAVYELAKAAVGEDKANEILEQNEIKLLN